MVQQLALLWSLCVPADLKNPDYNSRSNRSPNQIDLKSFKGKSLVQKLPKIAEEEEGFM